MSAPSTAQEFVAKWKQIELKERSASQAHFRDLCHVLGQRTASRRSRARSLTRFHETWALRRSTWLGVGNDPRYTPTTTFETFPFPEGLTPNLQPTAYTNLHADEIATVAARLNELRENWLTPPRVDRPHSRGHTSYPDRIVAKPSFEDKLKKRTLTNLYSERPTWLANIHRELDAAVAQAYGWHDFTLAMPDDEILRRLLAPDLERSA